MGNQILKFRLLYVFITKKKKFKPFENDYFYLFDLCIMYNNLKPVWYHIKDF